MNQGYSESECDEVYEHFKQHLPQVTDCLLRELAYNFKNDAFVGTDADDFISALSHSEPINSYAINVPEIKSVELELENLIADITSNGIRFDNVCGVLLVVVSNTMTHNTLFNLIEILSSKVNSDAVFIPALYSDESIGAFTKIRLVLSGDAS
ncbi:hypothetical protein [Methylotenera mobilis]|uniref:Uncharacterized protein n=1 Tax=Methylotenera mobilis (strain JLW8 / ATCC BAA-1282 / DSM 17540) TaxID=583345 RepID=C6WW81_METML|nr:hypothetical protein [Methylotenera mobilis]ACT48180.1 hypothetical protein Mmol_1274 [Methylotenera mobilis JLW8]